ncbi:hypothetical protein B0T11DRAFT_50059 [Plectosphaerella cucumerina]|uniref:Uncharacterized protein n=1 Tax=Plectosphaerella cucumerina TaxID=40658 RepID=A0A8K0X5A6_9PEZI|nr:hypothetical protein B0T11DRAFT_50059 [Plectosphaerella cucumerina]
MAELALGVAGVVPLALLVFKAHKSTREKLKIFRKYDDEAARLQKEFDIQRQFFRNEWRILLETTVEDANAISAMNQDFSHEDWSSPELNQHLTVVLGQNYETFLDIFEMIHRASEELENELERINTSDEDEDKTGKENVVVSKARRVREGIRVLRCSKSFTISIGNLKDAIGQLIALRGQMKSLAEPAPQKKALCPPRSSSSSAHLNIWSECLRMRKASTTLHAGLAEVWKCADANHRRHLFKLFVDSCGSDDEIQMKLALIFDCRTQMNTMSGVAHLEVRSRDVTWLEQHNPTAANDRAEPFPKRPKFLKLSRFKETVILSPFKTPVTSKQEQADEPCCISSNLRGSQDTCSELTRSCRAPPSTIASSTGRRDYCIGHIEVLSDPKFRHTFYSSISWEIYDSSPSKPCTLGGMIRDIHKETVDPVDKLRLARSVAMTMLKLHSTPWLGQVWQLQDMAMHVDDIEDLSRSLETLHVNVEFAKTLADLMDDVRESDGDGRGLDDARTDREIICNIKCRPLYSLGVAFLQIDRWAEYDLGDVLTIRKMAELPSSISKRFRDLTQRCLECDFGRGTGKDLSKATLQQAVCRSVVGELHTLIKLAEEMSFVAPMEDVD